MTTDPRDATIDSLTAKLEAAHAQIGVVLQEAAERVARLADICDDLTKDSPQYADGYKARKDGILSAFDAILALRPDAMAALERAKAVKVKLLDLSNAVKHAFIAGRVSAGASSSFHGEAWVDYDPTQSMGYARILAALDTGEAG